MSMAFSTPMAVKAKFVTTTVLSGRNWPNAKPKEARTSNIPRASATSAENTPLISTVICPVVASVETKKSSPRVAEAISVCVFWRSVINPTVSSTSPLDSKIPLINSLMGSENPPVITVPSSPDPGATPPSNKAKFGCVYCVALGLVKAAKLAIEIKYSSFNGSYPLTMRICPPAVIASWKASRKKAFIPFWEITCTPLLGLKRYTSPLDLCAKYMLLSTWTTDSGLLSLPYLPA